VTTRRGLVVSAAAFCVARIAAAQPAAPPSNRLAFRLVRDGSAIGTHVLTFARLDNGFDVHIDVDIAVGFGPLMLFRYSLRGLEQWRNGLVVHFDATTNDNGAPDQMRADRDTRGLWVEGSQAQRYLAPADALPATHWNAAELQSPWINPQDGRLLHPVVKRVGPVSVPLAGGRTEPATEYAVSGDVKLDIWYNASRQWSGLRFAAKDGSEVRYEMT
jgi:Family of unknown function (DUF6134)